MKLEGKAAIITGGTSGIGEATARMFAAEGAQVTIAGRGDKGQPVADSIGASGGAAQFVRTDVSRSADIEALVAAHMQAYGRLDVLFNNASYEGPGVSVVDTPGSAREGLAWPNLGAYIASKGAVIAFTRALAVEVSPLGIRVNSLNPGVVETPMLSSFAAKQADPDAFWAGLADVHLLKRIGRPDELARAALFLASDDGSFVTGSDMLVDGGLVLG